MSETLSGSSRGARKSTCGKCDRTVVLTPVDGGGLIALDPEVGRFVPAGAHGGSLASAEIVTGRRVHAELCDGYRLEAERSQRRAELRAFNARPARAARSANRRRSL